MQLHITRKQLQKLDNYLDNDERLDLAFLHGVITALVSAPEPIRPSQWLKYLDFTFESKQQAQTIMSIIMTLHNATIDLIEDVTFQPILNKDKKFTQNLDEVTRWAQGYLEVISTFFDDILTEANDTTFELLHPIASLAMSNDALQDMLDEEQETFSARELKQYYFQQLPDVIMLIYRHWRDGLTHDGSEIMNLPTGKKIGRNEPCPCGSGLKYKKCCLQDEVVLH